MATTVQQGVAPSGTNALGSNMMYGMMSDPSAKKAFYLSVTSLINDILKQKGLRWQKAAVTGLADYVALIWVNGFFAGPLAKLTGETMWSGLLSEGLSLSVLLMLSKNVGLVGSDKVDGLVQSPDLGSSGFSNWLESVLDVALMIGERQFLITIGQNTGIVPS